MSLGGLRQMSGDRKTHSRTLQVKHRLAEGGERAGRLLQGAGRQQEIYKVTVPYSESCIRRQMSLTQVSKAFHCGGLNRGLKRQ